MKLITDVLAGKSDTAKIMKLTDCWACYGFSKTKCWLCKRKRPKKEHLTKLEQIACDRVDELVKWCKATKAGMAKFGMPSTGCETLDKLIIREHQLGS